MTVSSCLPPADGSSSDGEPLSLLDRLPDDSLHHLLTFVDARSLASFACVSRGAAALAQLPSLWHRYVADQFSLAESPLARIPPRDVRHLLQRQPNRCAYQIGGSSVISAISNGMDRGLPSADFNAEADGLVAYEDMGLPGSEVTIAVTVQSIRPQFLLGTAADHVEQQHRF